MIFEGNKGKFPVIKNTIEHTPHICTDRQIQCFKKTCLISEFVDCMFLIELSGSDRFRIFSLSFQKQQKKNMGTFF